MTITDCREQIKKFWKKYQIPTKWYNDEDPDDLTTMVGLCRQMKRDYRGGYKKHHSDATAAQIEEAYNNFIPLGYEPFIRV